MLGVVIGVVAVLFVIIPVAFAALAILGAVFSGIAVLLGAGVFATEGVVPGIVLGFLAYRAFRRNRLAERAE